MVSGPNGVFMGHVLRLVEEDLSPEVENVAVPHRLMEDKSATDHRFNQLPARCKLVQVEKLALNLERSNYFLRSSRERAKKRRKNARKLEKRRAIHPSFRVSRGHSFFPLFSLLARRTKEKRDCSSLNISF